MVTTNFEDDCGKFVSDNVDVDVENVYMEVPSAPAKNMKPNNKFNKKNDTLKPKKALNKRVATLKAKKEEYPVKRRRMLLIRVSLQSRRRPPLIRKLPMWLKFMKMMWTTLWRTLWFFLWIKIGSLLEERRPLMMFLLLQWTKSLPF